MGYLNVKSFIYDGESSDAYGLMVCWAKNGGEEEVSTGLEVEIKRGDMNMVRTEPNQYGVVYSNTLSFEFLVLCKDGNDMSYDQSRAINKWLRNSNTYKILHFNDDNPEFINYYAVCTNIVDIILGGMMGKKLTFVCNSPFGYMQKQKKVIRSTSEPKEIKLYNSSDNGVYYPIIKFETDGSFVGTIKLENLSDWNALILDFEQVSANDGKKIVVMDGKKSTISDEYGSLIPAYKVGWNEVENIYWFRLLPEMNIIRSIGDCTITMTFEFPRKVGAI